MRKILGSRSCRAFRMAVSLPAALFVGSLLTTSMGPAADQHSHQGDVGEASAEKVIYREGGAKKAGIALAQTVTCCSRAFCWSRRIRPKSPSRPGSVVRRMLR